jgi:GDP-L-fucose synthase
MNKIKKRIFIAGHNGMVGSAIFRQLSKTDDVEIITRSRKELDLTNQQAVVEFFQTEKN